MKLDSVLMCLCVCDKKLNFLSWTIRLVFADPVTYYVVQSISLLKESLPIVLHGNVLPQITGPIQYGPLLQTDLESLSLLSLWKLADSIPARGNSTTVDILVGSDYFWTWLREKVILSSGLLLLAFKFGYILTGKYFDSTAEGER